LIKLRNAVLVVVQRNALVDALSHPAVAQKNALVDALSHPAVVQKNALVGVLKIIGNLQTWLIEP
jgi:hypothetical protein